MPSENRAWRSLKTYDCAFRWEVHRVKSYTALPASKVVIPFPKRSVSGETQAKTNKLPSEIVAVGQTDTLKCSWSQCKTRHCASGWCRSENPLDLSLSLIHI